MTRMNVLLLDGFNLIHRARSGFQKGDHPIPFNFFRGLRPFIEKFKPEICYMVLEGTPKRNLELLPSYKGNRQKMSDDFQRQADEVIQLVREGFPIDVAWHPDHEADDVIANIATNWTNSNDHDVTIVSNDSDFIQLLSGNSHVKLYNWLKKEFVTPPDYDYVKWKALRGDGSDNVPGVPGVGDKTAIKLLNDDTLFDKKMNEGTHRSTYERNLGVIRFHLFTDEEMKEIQIDNEDPDWGIVKMRFEEWDFKSMLKEKSWARYTKTFECLE